MTPPVACAAGMCAHVRASVGGCLHLPLQLLQLPLAAAAAMHIRQPRLQFLHVLPILAMRHRLVHPGLQLRQLLVVLVQLLRERTDGHTPEVMAR